MWRSGESKAKVEQTYLVPEISRFGHAAKESYFDDASEHLDASKQLTGCVSVVKSWISPLKKREKERKPLYECITHSLGADP